MKEVGKYVDAVVVITNQICGMDEVRQHLDFSVHTHMHILTSPDDTHTQHAQSDEVWLKNVRKLMDLTGDLPLGLYETPIPKVRYVWCAMCV